MQAWSLEVNGLPALNVSRPTFYGNPFRVGGWFRMGDVPGRKGPLSMAYVQALPSAPSREGYTLIETPAEAVEWFERYRARWPLAEERKAALRGNNLACWCAIGGPCHADALLRLAQ